MSGTRTTLFSCIPIMYEGVSGLASRRASTASTPWRVGYRNLRYYVTKSWIANYQNAIKCTRASTSLGMAQSSNTGIEAQPF